MNKYGALRFIATLHKIVGAVIVGIGVLAFFTGAGRSPEATGIAFLAGFGAALVCFVSGMMVYAFGELIYLFIGNYILHSLAIVC